MKTFYTRHKFDTSILADIKKLTKLDNYHVFLALFEDYLIIFLSIFLVIKSHYFLYPVGLLIIGARQRGLATILHEAVHNTLASSRFFANIMATFFSGYLIFSTFSVYKYTHVRLHHRYFADPLKDDDYKYMLFKKVYEPNTMKYYINRLFYQPLLYFTVPSHILFLMKSRCFKKNLLKSSYELILLVAYWILIISLAYNFQIIKELILFWIIPYFTTFQFINWFIELSEHSPLMKNQVDISMSRNRYSHWLENFLTNVHNEGYHLAHHLFPNIPYWNIQKLNDLLKRDSEYAELDNKFGGIFFSSNHKPNMIEVLKNYIENQNKNNMIFKKDA